MKKTIGASLIVKNESGCIRECLESIKGIDEIVIVDTGSEDNTVEICREYTKKVYTDYKWNDNFSEARNKSLDKVKSDYVLIIDADEVLQTPVDQLKETVNSYVMNKYLGIIFDVDARHESLTQIRLFKNIPEIRWHGAAHNRLIWSEGEIRSRAYKSTFNIKSGYSPAHALDPDRTLRILTKQLETDPNDTRALYYIAREYINRKDLDRAIEMLTRYYGIAFYKPWTNELADACYLLALAYIDKRDWHSAVTFAASAVLVLPSYKEPLIFLREAFKGFYPMASAFWGDLANKVNDNGVLFKRKIIE